jgi:hypothetical protein
MQRLISASFTVAAGSKFMVPAYIYPLRSSTTAG